MAFFGAGGYPVLDSDGTVYGNTNISYDQLLDSDRIILAEPEVSYPYSESYWGRTTSSNSVQARPRSYGFGHFLVGDIYDSDDGGNSRVGSAWLHKFDSDGSLVRKITASELLSAAGSSPTPAELEFYGYRCVLTPTRCVISAQQEESTGGGASYGRVFLTDHEGNYTQSFSGRSSVNKLGTEVRYANNRLLCVGINQDMRLDAIPYDDSDFSLLGFNFKGIDPSVSYNNSNADAGSTDRLYRPRNFERDDITSPDYFNGEPAIGDGRIALIDEDDNATGRIALLDYSGRLVTVIQGPDSRGWTKSSNMVIRNGILYVQSSYTATITNYQAIYRYDVSTGRKLDPLWNYNYWDHLGATNSNIYLQEVTDDRIILSMPSGGGGSRTHYFATNLDGNIVHDTPEVSKAESLRNGSDLQFEYGYLSYINYTDNSNQNYARFFKTRKTLNYMYNRKFENIEAFWDSSW